MTSIPCVLASNEDNANADVPSIDWPRESDLHIEVFLIVFSFDGTRLLPSSHVQYSTSNEFSVILSLEAYIRTNIYISIIDICDIGPCLVYHAATLEEAPIKNQSNPIRCRAARSHLFCLYIHYLFFLFLNLFFFFFLFCRATKRVNSV